MVILVDEHDNAIGTMTKIEAHKRGLLHRAFSILIFNTAGELLIQKRAVDKYHSGGLWANTCCSHPAPDEEIEEAAMNRLEEEMGMYAELDYVTSFIYHAKLDNGLEEHELDHMYIGITNDLPQINTQEVAEYKYMSLEKIREDMEKNPDSYAEWFKIIMKLDPLKIKE